MTMFPPEAACGRIPLKGATPAARQTRFRGISRQLPCEA